MSKLRPCSIRGRKYTTRRFRKSRARDQQSQDSSKAGWSELQIQGDSSEDPRRRLDPVPWRRLDPVPSITWTKANVTVEESAACKTDILTRKASFEKEL